MKKLFLLIIISVVHTMSIFSQNYRLIEWEIIGLSYLISTSNSNGDAVGFFSEVRVNFNDKMSIGLNANNQFFSNIHKTLIRGAGITNAYALTSDYYFFNKENDRGFVGLKIGIFDNSATAETGEDLGGKGLGLSPRVGYEMWGRLRVTATYNHTFKGDFPNYFSLGLGFPVGGRYK